SLPYSGPSPEHRGYMGHQISSPARRPVSRRLSDRPPLTIVEVSAALLVLLLGSALYPLSAATPTAAASAVLAAPTVAEEPNRAVTGDVEAAVAARGVPAVATGDGAASDAPATSIPIAAGAARFGMPSA